MSPGVSSTSSLSLVKPNLIWNVNLILSFSFLKSCHGSSHYYKMSNSLVWYSGPLWLWFLLTSLASSSQDSSCIVFQLSSSSNSVSHFWGYCISCSFCLRILLTTLPFLLANSTGSSKISSDISLFMPYLTP